ncbi:nucleotidyltransferase domain-containing protein [Picrophilus oshimae]
MLNNTINYIKKLDKNKRIKFIINYGFYANGTFHNGSDIDLCIYYDGTRDERNKFRLKMCSQR